jgi:hypothetical protein
MEYKYKIISINEDERQIVIASSNRSYMEEPNAFVNLVKLIQSEVNGTIENVGEMQFKITDDKFGLIYQWDGLFGISVIYPENISPNEAVDFLDNYMSEF